MTHPLFWVADHHHGYFYTIIPDNTARNYAYRILRYRPVHMFNLPRHIERASQVYSRIYLLIRVRIQRAAGHGSFCFLCYIAQEVGMWRLSCWLKFSRTGHPAPSILLGHRGALWSVFPRVWLRIPRLSFPYLDRRWLPPKNSGRPARKQVEKASLIMSTKILEPNIIMIMF